MSKVAERLIHLLDVSESLMARLHYIAHYGCKISLIHDKNNAKVIEALTKKFPEIPNVDSNIAGYGNLLTAAKEKAEELESFYQTFQDCLEWRDCAIATLNDVATSAFQLILLSNPYLTQHFLDLMLAYVQIHLLIPRIDERRIILALYAKAKHDQNFSKIAFYVSEYENAGKRLMEEFRNIAKRLGDSLALLKDFMLKSQNIQMLRKEGTLSITLNSLQLAIPAQEPFQFQFTMIQKFPLWIVFGFMFCPDELGVPDGLTVLKLALQTQFIFPVYRDVMFSAHAEYDSIFEKHKSKTLKLKKEKKYITDAVTFAVTQGGKSHRERRIYVRQELYTLCNIMKSKPGLLGPKFQVVLGALAMAKDEILSYYRHLTNPAPKGAGKYRDEDFKDNRITELIYWVQQMIALIRQHKRIVQMYYVEYLCGADIIALQDLMVQHSSKIGPTPTSILQEIVNELQTINLDQFIAGTEYNLKNLRLNWLRAEFSMSQMGSAAPIDSLRELVQRCNLIVHHSRFVDSIDEILQTNASLKHLWYYKDALFSTFEISIQETPMQPLYVSAFLRLLSEFTENAIAVVPTEVEVISRECLDIAKKYITKIVDKICTNTAEMVKKYTDFDLQLLETHAAVSILQKANFKFEKNFIPPVTPGIESEFAKKGELEGLRQLERTTFQLCLSLNELVSFPIADSLLTPREFLRDALCENLQNHFLRLIPDGAEIQRPTVLLRHFNVYCFVLKLLENYVDINIADIIRQVLVTLTYHRTLMPGRVDWVTDGELEGEGVLIRPIVQWFSDFLTKKLPLTKEGVISYSPLRRAFVSPPTALFKAEKIVEWNELRALATLIGPYGFKLLEREALKVISSNIAGVKELMQTNRGVLEELAKNYQKDQVFLDGLKRFRDLELLLQRSIAIGNALQFRKLIKLVIHSVVEEKVPYISANVQICFNQYKRNVVGVQELFPMDLLASDIGINVGGADAALKTILSKAAGSAESSLWDLLPIVYAIGFTSKLWAEISYKPNLEVFSNNVQVLVDTIYYLIVSLKPISNPNTTEKDLVQMLMDFIEISSFILLKNARSPKPTINLSSAFVFIDKFVESASLITRDHFESIVPYALLRGHYKEVYTAETKKGKGSTPQQQDDT